MNNEELVARDYVYCGERLDTKDQRYIAIRVIRDDGTLGPELMYEYKKAYTGTLGGIYTGAKFNEGHVRGLGNKFCKYKGRWPNAEDRLQWQMLQNQAETRLKIKKMEADEGRVSDLENALIDARRLYQKYYNAFDSSGCRALEQTVLQALRTPLRKIEES